jgi:hypothetical protein
MANKVKLLTSLQKSLAKIQQNVEDLKGTKKSPAQLDVALGRVSTKIAKVMEQIAKDTAKDEVKKGKTGKKKPLNSYMLFTKDYRSEVETKLKKGDKSAKINVIDVARELGKMWRGAPGEAWRNKNGIVKKTK